MSLTPSSFAAVLSNPLMWAGALIIAGFFASRYWRGRNSLLHFLMQLLIFAVLTGLLLAGDVVPYRTGKAAGSEAWRLLVDGLEIVWWLAAAWLSVGFLRAFLVLGEKPRESKLVQDLLGGLIYLFAMFGIVAYVFNLPVKGLLATSGALAIIIGLALQSSLGDVFSGIVLNLERPYHVGDWIILDDTVQGTVIETNWRATHILTGNQDIAIVPNSVIAKAKLVNCSAPSRTHGTSIIVKLAPSLTPAMACDLLSEVLLGTSRILQTPKPSVTIKDLSAEMIELELYYCVADVSVMADAQNEIFDRVYRAAASAGTTFAPRLSGGSENTPSANEGTWAVPEQLIEGVSLFSSLNAQEKTALAAKMVRKEYAPGKIIAAAGTIMESLCIVSYGVIIGREMKNGRNIERIRLTPGIYFGEAGLLMGTPLQGELTALTKVVIYEIPKDALLPLLKARPDMAEDLSEALASRQLSRLTVLDKHDHPAPHDPDLVDRVAANIKRLFSLH